MDSTTLTAYHEAGHAVASVLLGLGLSRVSITRDGDSLGRMIGGAAPREIRETGGASSWAAITWAQKRILVNMAGPAAEERAGADPADVLGGTDMTESADWSFDLCGGEEEGNAFLAWLWARARNFVAVPSHWQAIEALAQELQRNPDISGRKARAVIMTAR